MGIFLPLLLPFIIAFLLTPATSHFARKLGIMDEPRQREKHPATLHKSAVSRGGGIPVFLAIFSASIAFISFSQTLVSILIGAALILGIGLLDDHKPTSPYLRLVGNSLAALIIVLSGITISFFTNPFGGIVELSHFEFLGLPILAWGITLIFLVFMTNIVSWSSGVDGQLSGFVPIAAATLGALSLRFSQDITQSPVVLLSAIVAGAYLGFLFWSAYPQKIMPGYSGGALAGFLLGTLAILSGAKVATLLVVLAIPVVDALFVILRRLVTGRSPVKPDAGHLHHLLIRAGWKKAWVAFSYWGIAAILGFIVLHLNTQFKFYTIVMATVVIGGLIVWLTFWPLSARRGRLIG